MSDEDEEILRPQDSLCWNCKHGMVLHDSDTQTFMQPGIVPGNPFEGQGEEPGMNQISVEMNKIRSACFWNAKFSPLVFNKVTECNRFEKNVRRIPLPE